MTLDHTMVDPDGIGESGAGIGSAADQAKSHIHALQSDLAQYGEPWGNDDVGSLIGMCYDVIAGLAMDSYQTNIDGLARFAEGVKSMADSYRQAEDANTAGFGRIHDMLG
jgi:hypothetical protein